MFLKLFRLIINEEVERLKAPLASKEGLLMFSLGYSFPFSQTGSG